MDIENEKTLTNTYNLSNETVASPYSLKILESWLQQNPDQVKQWHESGELNQILLEKSESMNERVARMVGGGISVSDAEYEAGQMGAMPHTQKLS